MWNWASWLPHDMGWALRLDCRQAPRIGVLLTGVSALRALSSCCVPGIVSCHTRGRVTQVYPVLGHKPALGRDKAPRFRRTGYFIEKQRFSLQKAARSFSCRFPFLSRGERGRSPGRWPGVTQKKHVRRGTPPVTYLSHVPRVL